MDKVPLNLSPEEESLLESLEQQNNWDGYPICKFQGFWLPFWLFHPLLCFQRNFKARDTDIMLSSMPKSGTTWMKALLFVIANRNQFPIDQSPLLVNSSHKLVKSLECDYYMEHDNPDLETLPQPRVLSTHLPHQALASSLIDSKCKIVYICRNPLDQFISEQHFFLKNRLWPNATVCPLDESFGMYCDGVHAFGPFCDHLLGYWNASLENPDRVLFLKYEDLKRDSLSEIKKIAEFVGLPFSEEEEKAGLVGEISKLCSFDKLKDLEVNKKGVHYGTITNNSFYRKGGVGDWVNHLTPEMADRMKKLLEAKLTGSGLMLDI
ncbi:hypothetical protein BUALT_Bualt10G0097600 [Buddleja alternifolia]|uniref:Sulfotransferase n=1 Tax=Buddleja alternifolia TaxID=168488 RepID=A0AAV6WZ51_9LAMI|nr:hypothetical protein BUALT_Bualt10G0097600 [Buddleja alternifolia]